MSSWERDMRRLRGLTEKKMTKVYRIAVMETTKDIVMDTPVDEGRLRGNWQAGVNDQPSGQLDLLDKTGMTTIGRITAIIAPLQYDQKLVFCNNLPYAVPIEYGHSREKAPQGMVRRNLTNWNARVDRIARVVRNEQ